LQPQLVELLAQAFWVSRFGNGFLGWLKMEKEAHGQHQEKMAIKSKGLFMCPIKCRFFTLCRNGAAASIVDSILKELHTPPSVNNFL
jgi:hypothetical protein